MTGRLFPVAVAALVAVAGCQSQLAQGGKIIEVPVTASVNEEEVEFVGAGGVKLHGSLMIPVGSMGVKRPAVLLIQGSGPTDRDGNQPGFQADTLKQIAKGLASAGIVTFRFDKRACAKEMAQWPKDSAQYGPFFSWTNHVADTLAAWQAMTKNKLVDSNHCAILGHSEGGLLALSIAGEAKPAALVLVATPGRTFDVVVHDQLSAQLAKSGNEGKALLAKSDEIVEKIRATGQIPPDVPLSLRGLYNLSVGVYLQQVLGVVPTKLAAATTCPVLVMNGESDAQVSPTKDAKPLFAACPKLKESRSLIVPLASHNLKPVFGPGDDPVKGDIVPDAIEAIQGFLVPVIGGHEPEGQTDVHN